jgi:hypothetical protein
MRQNLPSWLRRTEHCLQTAVLATTSTAGSLTFSACTLDSGGARHNMTTLWRTAQGLSCGEDVRKIVCRFLVGVRDLAPLQSAHMSCSPPSLLFSAYGGLNGRGMKLNTHIYVASRFRMYGAFLHSTICLQCVQQRVFSFTVYNWQDALTKIQQVL